MIDTRTHYALKRVFQDKKEYFINIYPSKVQVNMCMGKEKEKIFEVKVRLTKENETSPYYGWWDAKDKRFCMIFQSKVQVETCFPYSLKAAEERGEGKLVNLVIKET